MTIVSEVVTLLKADTGAGGVATLCTGGIYDWQVDAKENGLNRNDTPNAFDTTTGILKPSCMVRSRADTPDNGIHDEGTGNDSARTVVELWFLNDKDAGFSVITTARDRAKVVFRTNKTASGFIPRWAGNTITGGRDADLNMAAVLRVDYDVRSVV